MKDFFYFFNSECRQWNHENDAFVEITRFWCVGIDDYLAEIVVIYAKLTWSFLDFCDITYGCSLIVRFLKNQKPRLRFDLFGLNENHKSYHNLPLWNQSKHANKRCCLYLFTRIRPHVTFESWITVVRTEDYRKIDGKPR